MARSAVIAGGGIFGVTAALALARRGVSVTLIEAGAIPRPEAASTDISKVVRADYGADDFTMSLALAAMDGWRAWNERFGEELFVRTGFLLRTREPMAPGGFEMESYERLRRRGFAPERLSRGEARARFPQWSAAYTDGYLSPHAGWVPSGRVVELLAGEARAAGVAVREREALVELMEHDGAVVGARTAGGELRADVTVVACGAWIPEIVPELGDVMWPVAQPVLCFMPERPEDFRPPRFVPFAADITRTGFYGFAAADDGRVKIAHHGAGVRAYPDSPPAADEAVETRFRAFLRETFPALADAPLVEHRTCFYCDTFDGDFLIARHPDRPGLVVAGGGSGHAFKMAPLLGDLIADAVEGRDRPELARYGWRERGAVRREGARAGG